MKAIIFSLIVLLVPMVGIAQDIPDLASYIGQPVSRLVEDYPSFVDESIDWGDDVPLPKNLAKYSDNYRVVLVILGDSHGSEIIASLRIKIRSKDEFVLEDYEIEFENRLRLEDVYWNMRYTDYDKLDILISQKLDENTEFHEKTDPEKRKEDPELGDDAVYCCGSSLAQLNLGLY